MKKPTIFLSILLLTGIVVGVVDIFVERTVFVDKIVYVDKIVEETVYVDKIIQEIQGEIFPFEVTIYNESKIYKANLLFDLDKSLRQSSDNYSKNIGGYYLLVLDENYTVINTLGEFGIGITGKLRGEWLDSENVVHFGVVGARKNTLKTGLKIWNLEDNSITVFGINLTHHDFQVVDDTSFCLEVSRPSENQTMKWDKVIQCDFDGNLIWDYDLFDIIPSNYSYQESTGDISHANSLHFDGEKVYVNARNTHTFYVIDYDTKELLYSVGKYGDFEMLERAQWYSSHSYVKLNETDFLMFDNHGAEDKFDTRAIHNRLNFDDMTCELIAEWIIPKDLYCGSWGSVQLLPNNNVLISAGNIKHDTDDTGLLGGAILEYTYDGELVSKIQFPLGWGIYRAFKDVE